MVRKNARTLAMLAVVALAAVSCDRGGSTSTAKACDAATPVATELSKPASAFCTSSLRAEYRVRNDSGFESFTGLSQLTLIKDGTSRLRYDMNLQVENRDVTITGIVQRNELVICFQNAGADIQLFGIYAPDGEDACYRGDEDRSQQEVSSAITEGFSFSTSERLVSTSKRRIADIEADCYQTTSDTIEDGMERCFSSSGALLAFGGALVSFEATEISDQVSDGDFSPPFEIRDMPPEPTEEPDVYETRVPPVTQTVRIALHPGATQPEIDAAIEVLKRRVELGPGCVSIPFKDDCVSGQYENGQIVLTYGVWQDQNRSIRGMTDDEITAWLTATSDDTSRISFCEPLQNEQGQVATIRNTEQAPVVYINRTCEPVLDASRRVQTEIDGASTFTQVEYVDKDTASLSDVVWTPAIGEVDGRLEAFTSEHLLPDASFFQPIGSGWRVIYKTDAVGEQLLASITRRLAPKTRAEEQRALEEGYPLVVFVDGVPVREASGQVSAFRIFAADFPPGIIDEIPREEALRIAQIINAPRLKIAVEVLSIEVAP